MSTTDNEAGTRVGTDPAPEAPRASGRSSSGTSAMRDGAMARVAPRRDLAARRQSIARTGTGTATPPVDRSAPDADVEPGDGWAQRAAADPTAEEAPAGRPDPATGRAPGNMTGPGSRPGRTMPSAPGTGRGGRTTGPRRVKLSVQRVDPWSVFKVAFLVSVALGIAGVVMVAVLWTALSGTGVFTTINEFVVQVTSGENSASTFDLMNYIGLGRVVSLAVVFGVINVILLTALATLTAILYNICSALVGGAHLTLSDE